MRWWKSETRRRVEMKHATSVASSVRRHNHGSIPDMRRSETKREVRPPKHPPAPARTDARKCMFETAHKTWMPVPVPVVRGGLPAPRKPNTSRSIWPAGERLIYHSSPPPLPPPPQQAPPTRTQLPLAPALTSSIIRCCGSMERASAGGTPKKESSNAHASPSDKKPPRVRPWLASLSRPPGLGLAVSVPGWGAIPSPAAVLQLDYCVFFFFSRVEI